MQKQWESRFVHLDEQESRMKMSSLVGKVQDRWSWSSCLRILPLGQKIEFYEVNLPKCLPGVELLTGTVTLLPFYPTKSIINYFQFTVHGRLFVVVSALKIHINNISNIYHQKPLVRLWPVTLTLHIVALVLKNHVFALRWGSYVEKEFQILWNIRGVICICIQLSCVFVNWGVNFSSLVKTFFKHESPVLE